MTPPSLNDQSPKAGQAIEDLLAALVQSKQFLGFQYASWCIRGPSLEANIALAGMAQEELGHAIALGGLLGDDPRQAVPDKDTLITWDRWPQAAGSTAFAMIEDWPTMIVTCLARDAAATATLTALQDSTDVRLAQRARKMIQEEQFHLVFGMETARTFAAMPRETRQSLTEDYRRVLAEAETELGSAETLSRLTASGALPAGAVEARAQFLEGVTQRLNDAWRG